MPTLTRGWGCNLSLQLLLGLVSDFTLTSKSHRTRDHILLSHLRLSSFNITSYVSGLRWRYSNTPPSVARETGTGRTVLCRNVYRRICDIINSHNLKRYGEMEVKFRSVLIWIRLVNDSDLSPKFCCTIVAILHFSLQSFAQTVSAEPHTCGNEMRRSVRMEKTNKQKQTPWPLVRKRTISTERPPLVDEIYCQLLWIEGCRVVSAADPPRRMEKGNGNERPTLTWSFR
jgi:hypothetical protein